MTDRRGYSYRHRDAKVGPAAPHECLNMYIFDTEAEAAEFMRANLRDPHEFLIISGNVEDIGYGRSRLTPDTWSEVPRG